MGRKRLGESTMKLARTGSHNPEVAAMNPRLAAMADRRQMVEHSRKLSPEEVEDYLRFEFGDDTDEEVPMLLSDKLKQYYLKLKFEGAPEKAEAMKLRLKTVLESNIITDKEVVQLLEVLSEYIVGPILEYNGVTYSVYNGRLLKGGEEISAALNRWSGKDNFKRE